MSGPSRPWIQKGKPIQLPLGKNMYTQAKERAKYKSNKPSLTDQSQANDTNLNVIIKKYAMTGKAPGGATPLPPGDYTDSPEDLRGHLELAKRIKDIQATLPENLKGLTLEQLARVDNKELALYDQMITKQKEKRSNEQPNSTTKQNGDSPNQTGETPK